MNTDYLGQRHSVPHSCISTAIIYGTFTVLLYILFSEATEPGFATSSATSLFKTSSADCAKEANPPTMKPSVDPTVKVRG